MHVLLRQFLKNYSHVGHAARRLIMKDCCVHHVEFGVRNGDEFQRKFASQYKFVLSGTRFLSNLKQWVLKSQNATVLVTQPLSEERLSSDPYFVPWQQNSSDCIQTKLDSVFNVALKVKNLTECVDKLTRSGVQVIKEPRTITDKYGSVKLAVIKSCVGNAIHTLVQAEDYSGIFLPGFDSLSQDNSTAKQLVSHFDHIAFVLEQGESGKVLDWYSQHLGMRRFLINRDESEEDGFVIDKEEVGLRLKAFEYWKCAETGLTSDAAVPNTIKFVLAESLPGQGPNQVDEFLHHHGGPGIQHIGLHTDDIIQTVSQLKQGGVQFAEPPYTYYTEVGKLEEIQDIGENVDLLRENGILVDAEADPGELLAETESSFENRDNCFIFDYRLIYPVRKLERRSPANFSFRTQPPEWYLLQKFTKNIFSQKTFFLEIIQRVGARGFGSGNITALWRSVQAYMDMKEQEGNS